MQQVCIPLDQQQTANGQVSSINVHIKSATTTTKQSTSYKSGKLIKALNEMRRRKKS